MDMNEQLFGDYQPPTRLEKAANAFRSVGHKFSLIPYIGGVFAIPLTAGAALFDSIDGFANKGFKTGAKKLVAGSADAVVTAGVSAVNYLGGVLPIPTFWIVGNWGSALASGDTLGELARKGTQGVMDSMIADSKTPAQIAREKMVLGTNPMTRGAVPAGIGYAAGMQPQMAMTAPMSQATGQPMPENFWSDKEAQRRGQSPKDARANWMSNNREDAVALSRAAAQEAEMGA